MPTFHLRIVFCIQVFCELIGIRRVPNVDRRLRTIGQRKPIERCSRRIVSTVLNAHLYHRYKHAISGATTPENLEEPELQLVEKPDLHPLLPAGETFVFRAWRLGMLLKRNPAPSDLQRSEGH